MISFLIFLFLFGLLFIDCMIPLFKAYFAREGFNAYGSYFGNILLIVSRGCVAIYLPLSAYLVQEGVSGDDLSKIYSLSLLSICIVSFFLSFKINKFRRVFNFILKLLFKFFPKFNKPKVKDQKILNSDEIREKNKNYKLFFFIVLIAAFINSLGITLPMTLAAKYASNSLVFSQIGPFINCLGTLLWTLIIEGYLSFAYENTNQDPSLVFFITGRLFIYRSFGYLFALLFLTYI